MGYRVLILVLVLASSSSAEGRRVRRKSKQGALEHFFFHVVDCKDLVTCDLCASGKSSFLRMKCQWCGDGVCRTKTSGLKSLFGGKHCPEATAQVCAAEARFQVPERSLNPEDWFLTADEITSSRGGIQRDDLSTFTTNNAMKFLQTGKQVFEQVYEDLQRTQENDLVLFSQWCFGPQFLPFVATDPENTKMGDVFSGAVDRGVEVKFLLWRNTVNAIRENADQYQRDFQATIKEAAATCTEKNPNSRCDTSSVLIDGRGPGKAGSIHQKFSIMRHGDEMSAMVGGIDLNWARWDTKDHGTSELRKQYIRDPTDEEGNGGWIDRHVKIVGNAANDLANSFIERWNSKIPMDKAGSWVLDALSWKAGPEIEIVDPNPTDSETLLPVVENDEDAGAAVQIVRTYPCTFDLISGEKTYAWEFAQKGETSYLSAVLKAIRRSREYVYIEDQYGLFQQEIFEALAESLEGGHVRHVVVLIAHSSGVHLAGCATSQYQMWMPLKVAYPDRLTLFVRKDNAFVHSKFVLVDDVYALIGSANIGYRSFTSDPEIGAAIVDTHHIRRPHDNVEVAKFAHDARVRSWAEHANVTPEEMRRLSIKDAVARLKSETSHVVDRKEWDIKEGRALGFIDSDVIQRELCALTDPDGRCDARD